MANYQNDIFYTASLLEYLARKTKNTRKTIAEKIGIDGIREIFRYADVNHCLSFEQVSDELIEQYQIDTGDFAPEEEISSPPDFLAIGQNYANIVVDSEEDPNKYPETLYEVFCSKVAEWMTLYDNAFFYSPRDYLALEFNALKQ